MSQKPIPSSIEAEESLLGNIIAFPSALTETIESDINSKDFYFDKHQRIFSIIADMYDKHEKVDVVSVSSKLKDFDLLDKIGGVDYLLKLTNSTVGAANTKEYIRIIKQKSVYRQIIKVAGEISDEAFDGKNELNTVLEQVEEKVLNITRHNTSDGFKDGKEVFDKAINRIEEIEAAGGGITGVRSGYSDLDNVTAGFQKSDFIVIAARPSVGKTALGLNMALNAAATSPGAVAFFSCEMAAEQIAMRMLSSRAQVDGQKIRMGRLSEEDWSKINEAKQVLKNQKFYIDDSNALKVSDMLAKCRKLKNEHGLSIVFIDYIQLIESSNKAENRQQEVSEISRRLKAMARELEVPVVALSQLSRSPEKRDKKSKRPGLADIRESGAIEQDADLVLLLYREGYYNQEEQIVPNSSIEDIEVNIAKHRNGPTKTITLQFDKNCNRFFSVAKSKEANG